MYFLKTDIPDVIVCQPKIHEDNRGHFFESFRQDELEKNLGYKVSFCQDNESYSIYGTLRGLHFQKTPYAQAKLVRVVKGEIIDVAVDIRKGSKTFGCHVKVRLNEKNRKQLFIPKGFAHGFVVTSKNAKICYKVDSFYSHKYDSGIIFNDKNLNKNWEIDLEKLKISDKDKNLLPFKSIK